MFDIEFEGLPTYLPPVLSNMSICNIDHMMLLLPRENMEVLFSQRVDHEVVLTTTAICARLSVAKQKPA